MGVPRPLLQVLGFIQQVGIAEVFVFVSSSLTKLMHFGQAFLVDFSLSPAHIYGDICTVFVIEQPMCQICRKGQQVVHGPEKKIQWGTTDIQSCALNLPPLFRAPAVCVVPV